MTKTIYNSTSSCGAFGFAASETVGLEGRPLCTLEDAISILSKIDTFPYVPWVMEETKRTADLVKLVASVNGRELVNIKQKSRYEAAVQQLHICKTWQRAASALGARRDLIEKVYRIELAKEERRRNPQPVFVPVEAKDGEIKPARIPAGTKLEGRFTSAPATLKTASGTHNDPTRIPRMDKPKERDARERAAMSDLMEHAKCHTRERSTLSKVPNP